MCRLKPMRMDWWSEFSFSTKASESKTKTTIFFRLYLVLIKAKQDDLKHLQPLRLFQPFKQAFGLAIDTPAENSAQMTPKKLIQEFKLDQSQLAFTYCSLSQDGRSYIPEWNTMVVSTVMKGKFSIDLVFSSKIKFRRFLLFLFRTFTWNDAAKQNRCVSELLSFFSNWYFS